MVNLKDVIATILNDMTSARVEADVESLRIAEIYSKDELLKNMPIPKMRIKNFTVTLPIAIDSIDEKRLDEAKKPLTAKTVINLANKTLTNVLSRKKISLSGTDIRNVMSSLQKRIQTLAKDKSWISSVN